MIISYILNNIEQVLALTFAKNEYFFNVILIQVRLKNKIKIIVCRLKKIILN